MPEYAHHPVSSVNLWDGVRKGNLLVTHQTKTIKVSKLIHSLRSIEIPRKANFEQQQSADMQQTVVKTQAGMCVITM